MPKMAKEFSKLVFQNVVGKEIFHKKKLCQIGNFSWIAIFLNINWREFLDETNLYSAELTWVFVVKIFIKKCSPKIILLSTVWSTVDISIAKSSWHQFYIWRFFNLRELFPFFLHFWFSGPLFTFLQWSLHAMRNLFNAMQWKISLTAPLFIFTFFLSNQLYRYSCNEGI